MSASRESAIQYTEVKRLLLSQRAIKFILCLLASTDRKDTEYGETVREEGELTVGPRIVGEIGSCACPAEGSVQHKTRCKPNRRIRHHWITVSYVTEAPFKGNDSVLANGK